MSGGKLRGTDQLMQFLGAFPQKLQKNALRSAMIAGARVIRDEARANVPVESGQLRAAIKTSSPRVMLGDQATVKVKLLGKHSYVGRFIEYGVRPHLITAGDSKYQVRTLNARINRAGMELREDGLIKINGFESTRNVRTKQGVETRVMEIGKHFVSGAVMHPGIAPKPFLRPAIDTKGDEAREAFAARLRSYIKEKSGFTSPDTLEPDEDEE